MYAIGRLSTTWEVREVLDIYTSFEIFNIFRDVKVDPFSTDPFHLKQFVCVCE